MTFGRFSCSAALVAAALMSALPAAAQNSPAAQRVLDKAKAASGARGWNALRALHQVGKDNDAPFERWCDPVRYGVRTETGVGAAKHVEAYNGAADWRMLASGLVVGSADRAVLAEVRSDAFFCAHAYFFPSRFDLRSSHAGRRESGGRTYDVLKVQPVGGEPRDLWFDQRTGMLGLIVDETGPRQGRMELSDYRRVGSVLIPFRATTYGGGRSSPQVRVLERVDLTPVERALFSAPPAAR
ncbi:hypothetical protein [Phenylobacterium sp.]|uniref:hypothetical protein n=1 Tax=Phenylobacterium sp. TaxID=1871053 RepID=UPI00286A0480|nr:hypothetical protein [Phenylobacterium sp.]